MRLSRALPFLLLVVPSLAALSLSSSSAMTFCKCLCFGNSTILPLYLPKDPAHPCLSCTRQFCLDQKLAACVGAKSGDEDLDTATGQEGDVEARCFQRDSPQAHFLVILFMVLTGGLLCGAVLKLYGIDIQSMWARNGFKGVILGTYEMGRATAGRRNQGSGYR